MSRAVIQNGMHLQYEHFGPAATPLSFNVDFARAILNFGSRGSLTDNTRSLKEPDSFQAATLDDFLLDDLAEFSSEEIAAPISNKDFKVPKFESCEALSTLCNNGVPFEGNGAEAKLTDEPNLNSLKDTVPPLCNDMAPELEWFSAFDDETYALHGVSKFEENAFLSISNDQIFFPASGMYVSPLEKDHPHALASDRVNSTACHHEDLLSRSIDPQAITPKDVSFTGRARSKRSRSGVRFWSSGVLSNTSSTRNGSMGSTSEFSDPFLDSADLYPDVGADECDEIALDSQNEWKASRKSKKGQDTGQAKRCAHCLSQKTPQWRAGPTGPKTLCNACGVRYKSGRLFPEYRPAKSPTFLNHVHSNSHKKVLEMRRERAAPSLASLQGDGDVILKPACLELDQYAIHGKLLVGLKTTYKIREQQRFGNEN